tara:strand:- start:234 stop:374 length:141 start_codon:yes stop_codon:yes gene_type:complete
MNSVEIKYTVADHLTHGIFTNNIRIFRLSSINNFLDKILGSAKLNH